MHFSRLLPNFIFILSHFLFLKLLSYKISSTRRLAHCFCLDNNIKLHETYNNIFTN